MPDQTPNVLQVPDHSARDCANALSCPVHGETKREVYFVEATGYSTRDQLLSMSSTATVMITAARFLELLDLALEVVQLADKGDYHDEHSVALRAQLIDHAKECLR